jgi:hypothetical protein
MKKTFEEIVEDFKKLNWRERHVELNLLIDKYVKSSKNDIVSKTVGFSETDNIWHLYTKLKDIEVSEFGEEVSLLTN